MSPVLHDTANLTVHHFSYATFSIPQSTLLEQGRNILGQGPSGAETWHRGPIIHPPHSSARTFQFIYTPSPPRIAGKRSIKLQEWGVPPDKDEIYRVQDLTDFTSTEFPLARMQKFASTPLSYQTAPERKRELDSSVLTELIPQPHIMPSPIRTSNRQIEILPYKKSVPVMISPYTLPLEEFDEWSRCSWIIPIRGKFPWPESTSSVLLEPCDELPASPNSHTNELVWTPTSITKFWGFLMDLQTAGNLGPLGLSYRPVLSKSLDDKSSRLTKTTTTAEPSRSTVSTTSSYASLVAVDHIRIYHDWMRTFQLRTILDSWSFVSSEDRIRLLLGARLVLLDDRSQGVMVL